MFICNFEIFTPISSTNILSNPTGPKELLTILAIEAAARTKIYICVL